MPATNIRTRTCTLCAQKDIKYLGEHLKKKHNLLTAKERAPHLKRSLLMQKEDNDAEEKKAVKSVVTVCEETNDAIRSDALAEFQEQERALSADFRTIEDNIVSLRLRAMNAARDALYVDGVMMEVREKLMPLYEMVIESLKTSLYDNAPPMQLKRTNDERDAESPEPKRKRKRASKSRKTSSDVRDSGCGMDYLKNGLVRCQLCKFTWDGNAQHDCPYIDELMKL